MRKVFKNIILLFFPMLFAAGIYYLSLLLFAAGIYYLSLHSKPIPPIGAVIPCRDDATKGIEKRMNECPIPANERATFKGKEIEKIGAVAKVRKQFSGGDYYIEIISMNAISDGVEVFARAWNSIDGTQIGFGADGTIDIERFVFVNPPILVDDPNGGIIRQWNDRISGKLETRALREDPKEAILQSLVHTISVKQQKFRSTNIVAGKIGNTTLTAYPQPSTGTAPIDGQQDKVYGAGSGVAFSTIQAITTASTVDNTSSINDTLLGSDSGTNNFRLLYRFGSGFNTSSIGSDTVDSATISFYGRTAGSVTGLGDTNAQIVDFNPADGSLFAIGDFGNYGTALFSNTEIAVSAIVNDYNNFPLNASGIANINGSGNSYFGKRLKWDAENNFTGTWAGDQNTNWQAWAADNAGTTQDPKLVVEHTAGAPADAAERRVIIIE